MKLRLATLLLALWSAGFAFPAHAGGVARIGCEQLRLELSPPLTEAIVDEDWETGNQHGEAPARLKLYGCGGQLLDTLVLAAPLARLDATPLRNPRGPVFLVSADLTAPAGSYSGPLTIPVLVADGKLRPAADQTGPILLAATGKSGWEQVPDGAVDDLLMVNCAMQNGQFVTFYRRYRPAGADWRVTMRAANGFWEADAGFPPLGDFPK
jgi:hypothetical protein